MHPLVRDLYKRFLHVGKDYPMGLDWVRKKAKEGILANRTIVEEVEIKRKVARGRYMVRELKAVIVFKKYRTMKRRYDGHAPPNTSPAPPVNAPK